MKLLADYFAIQKKIYDHFRYTEDWVVIPLNDQREMFWILNEKAGFVRYSETEEQLSSGVAYYEAEIYKQRFLSKWVYPADDCTMICVDTHSDGNKFLMIFDNSKKRKGKPFKAVKAARVYRR